MWVITVINAYSGGNNVTMYKFETEKEARETFENLQGCKILSEIICCHHPSSTLVTT
ncbi:hypothetical protein HNP21_005481 [Bacillus aryabhattai]|uniref:Uncharacterized protein n=1 Tax=Priestia aryabhattai TaxID=412384 RepID=A0A7W3RHE3_PRIAR|nr:hypothetical protein [Priestia aryabhattai]MBA9042346.1 hypothetical protein [Priestia aryabhattai]